MATSSSPLDGTPTPPQVARHATEAVKLNAPALIGVFGNTEARRALILLPRGQTRTVGVGDTLDGGQVAAIGEDQLVLSRRGREKIMRLPRG